MSQLFPNLKIEKKPNLFLWAIIGCATGLILFYLWLLRIEPVYTWVAPLFIFITGSVNGIIANFSPAFNNIIGYVNQNPIALLSAAIPMSIALFSWYSKHKANEEASQMTLQAQQAQATALQSYQELQLAQQKIKEYEAKATAVSTTDFSQELAEAQKLTTSQAQELQRNRTEIETLQRLLEDLKLKTYEKTVVK